METAFQLLPMKSLVPSKTNPRKHFDEQEQKDLVASVKEKGVLEPILARPVGKGFEVVAGERRYRANKTVGNETIPAMVKELTDQEALEIQVIENTLRSDMTPIEEANGYKRLHEDHGYTYDDLAAKIGKAKSYIYTRLRLLALAPAVQKALAAEKIPIGYAEQFLRLADYKSQERLLDEIDDQFGDIHSLAHLKQAIENEYLLELSKAPFDTKDPLLVAKAGACTVCPKRTGAQTELLDVAGKKDCCLDGACHAAKLKAHNAVIVEKYTLQGKKVLTGDQAQTFVNRRHDMQDIDKTDDGLKNRSSWRQALRKAGTAEEVETVVVVDSDNKVREFALEKDLHKQIPKTAFESWASSPISSPKSTLAGPARIKRLLELQATRRAWDPAWKKAVTVMAAKDMKGKTLETFAQILIGRVLGYGEKRGAEERLGKENLSSAVKSAKNDTEVLAILWNVLLCDGRDFEQTGLLAPAKDVFAAAGVDWKRVLEAEVSVIKQEKEVKAKEKAAGTFHKVKGAKPAQKAAAKRSKKAEEEEDLNLDEVGDDHEDDEENG